MTNHRSKLIAFVLLALLAPASVPAMNQSSAPPKFNVPWANTAVAPYIRNIPQASQIGIQNCAASLTDGFPPLTFVPASAGGCPPFGQDFNGVLKQITQWSQWQAAGGPVFYDGALSTSIGGYPKGAVLQSSVLAGRLWFSTADNNATDPDSTSAANWTVLPGTTAPGTPIASLSTAAPPNTVSANGLTVGNASSNATSRHSADTYWLFVFLWTNCPNSQCQLYNSSGGAIARGASAGADFAANDAIATVNMNGAALMGADSQAGTTSSNLVNVPVSSGSRTVPMSILGENLHTLTVGELATHNHTITDPCHTHGVSGGAVAGTRDFAAASGGGDSVPGGATGSFSITSAMTGITATNNNGSNTPHNTVPRSVITYWNLAL
jgi:hypothetical protein